MHKIAIIGAGQLGRRHLQGLSHANAQASLHVVDPSASALEAARLSLAESAPAKSRDRTLSVHTSAAELPADLDLAIIATTADVRMAALRALCESAPPRYLILEKVLFQRPQEYEEAARLIERHGIIAWVNCPRRAFAVYRELREFFADDPVRDMQVYGGEWGLGCNGIHFLDLLQFLTGGEPLVVDTSELAADTLPSKRNGFVEFSGSLCGSIGSATFRLTSLAGSTKPHLITLHSGGAKSVIIDEARGELWRHAGTGSALERFELPYQSQLSGTLADSILDTGSCALTPFHDSVALHLPFIRALAQHATGDGVNDDRCPIT